MYPSGRREGFWVQKEFGRQPMHEFVLNFRDGDITGHGTDLIGEFTFAGAYDVQTGRVLMVKQYHGRHVVRYAGDPDGEGCIQGTWNIGDTWTGPFLLRPVLRRPRGDEPIQSISDL